MTNRMKYLLATTAFALAMSAASTPVLSETWYVQAESEPPWQGTKSQPFSSLSQVEVSSRPGDHIVVLPSTIVLDGGIRLKDRQKLTGLGPEVTKVSDLERDAHAQITNSTSEHLEGDAIRLANDNTVKNIHIDGAYRSGILGINATSPTIEDNLITKNMDQHDLPKLQTEFVVFQPQRNHFGAITLLACGRRPSADVDHCKQHDPLTKGIASTGEVVIKGNEIRDSNLEGIVLLNDTGVVATYKVKDNSVCALSQGLGDPGEVLPAAGLPEEAVRSRGLTLIAGNESRVTLEVDGYEASYLAPKGDYASDGIVLVTFGSDVLITADISDVIVSNPDGTGDAISGDSLELSHYGSNSMFDVRVKRAQLSDSVSTLIKLLEVGPVTGNSFNVEIADSVLSNTNPRARIEPALGAIAYVKILFGPRTEEMVDTVQLTVKDTKMSGHMRGINIANLNKVPIEKMYILVERSSLSDMKEEGFRVLNTADIGNVKIDLGNGLLGSAGHNRFTNNGSHDVSVVNSSATTPIGVFAAKNYWGGEAAPTKVNVAGDVEFFTSGTAREFPLQPTRVAARRRPRPCKPSAIVPDPGT